MGIRARVRHRHNNRIIQVGRWQGISVITRGHKLNTSKSLARHLNATSKRWYDTSRDTSRKLAKQQQGMKGRILSNHLS